MSRHLSIRIFSSVIAIGLLSSTVTGEVRAENAASALDTNQLAFFDQVKSMCGARFEGKSVFPNDPDDAFTGQLLVAVIESCEANEIRIPFMVGTDSSRTWVLKKTVNGLQLKHDHRHPDGTPDEVTLYGGVAVDAGSSLSQSFPADSYTAKLIPEASSNEWFLSFSDNGLELTYYLERHGKARFKAVLYKQPAEKKD